MHKIEIRVEITSCEIDGLFARLAPNPTYDDLEYDALIEQLMRHLADLKIQMYLKKYDLVGRVFLVPGCRLMFDYLSNVGYLLYYCTNDQDAVMLKLSQE